MPSPVQLLTGLGRAITSATAHAEGIHGSLALLALPTGLPSGVGSVRTGSPALRLLVRQLPASSLSGPQSAS